MIRRISALLSLLLVLLVLPVQAAAPISMVETFLTNFDATLTGVSTNNWVKFTLLSYPQAFAGPPLVVGKTIVNYPAPNGAFTNLLYPGLYGIQIQNQNYNPPLQFSVPTNAGTYTMDQLLVTNGVPQNSYIYSTPGVAQITSSNKSIFFTPSSGLGTVDLSVNTNDLFTWTDNSSYTNYLQPSTNLISTPGVGLTWKAPSSPTPQDKDYVWYSDSSDFHVPNHLFVDNYVAYFGAGMTVVVGVTFNTIAGTTLSFTESSTSISENQATGGKFLNFDGSWDYKMQTVAPTAAQVGGTLGSKTNHIIVNLNGNLTDYWSDGTTLYSKQLAP